MRRRGLMTVGLLLACNHETPPSPERAASSTEAAAAVAADPVAAPGPVAAPAPFADWREDPRITASLQGSESEPPRAIESTPIVEQPDLRVDLLESVWDDAEPNEDAQRRNYTIHLLVRQPSRAQIVALARQERAPGYGSLGPPQPPTIDDLKWHPPGADGPELVLTVATRSVWGTQCDDGQDDRRDLIVCELGTETEDLRCARAPLELAYFDGCGGAEAYDDGPESEERCARVGFGSSWKVGARQLEITVRDGVDVDCLDENADGAVSEPLRPVPSPIGYEALLGAHGLTVTTIDSAP